MKALIRPRKIRKARKHPDRVRTADYDLTPVASTGVQALLARAGEACTPAVFSFPRVALIVIHKSVQGMDVDLGVGRNKTARRQPGWVFPAIGVPETPILRLTRGQAYSGLRRDVYNDERNASLPLS